MNNSEQSNSEPIGKVEVTDGANWFALATENWVLNNINIDTKPACLVATNSNFLAVYNNGENGVGATLTGINAENLIIDNVSLNLGDTVLIKNQISQLENGVYKVTNPGSAQNNWVLTRSDNFNSISQMKAGVIINVIKGIKNKLTGWMLISTVTSIGNDSINFVKFTSDEKVDDDVYDLLNILNTEVL